MTEKLLSFNNQLTIADESGHELFLAKSKLTSLGNQYTFTDLAGKELAFIKQRVFAWRPTYEIHCEGRPTVVIQQGFLPFLNPKLTIKAIGPDGSFTIKGSGLCLKIKDQVAYHEYTHTIERPNKLVAKATWEFHQKIVRGIAMPQGGTCEIEVNEGEDPIFLLACYVVIYIVCHKGGARLFNGN
jgi:uncharacterized protein YxjI